MTIIKTEHLTGAQLDWAVAKAEGIATIQCLPNKYPHIVRRADNGKNWHPSTGWTQGGPIIEREGISVSRFNDECIDVTESCRWFTSTKNGDCCDENAKMGPTPLIAAMRCFVAAKLGDSVDVPEELA
jgi:hypothetical protein